MRDLYFIKILESFFYLRENNKRIYLGMFRRIRSTFSSTINNKKKIKNSIYRYKKFFFFLNIFSKIKKYNYQNISIRNNVKEVLRIGISNRFIDYSSSLEDTLRNNSILIGNKNNKLDCISQAIEGSGLIYLFDGDMESKFWNYYKYNDNKFMIIDGNFLIYLFICNFFKRIFSISKKNSFFILINRILYFKKNISIKLSLLNIIFIHIIDDSISSLNKKKLKYNLVTFTANNFLTEILRANSILSQDCKSIIELTHGALSYPAFEFYQNLYQHELEYRKTNITKQKLVHFIPNLPKPPLEFSEDIYENDICLNSQLVSRYLEREKFFQDKDKYVQYLNSMCDEKKKVISIFGGTGLGDNFYDSFEYDLEIYIIDILIDKFKSYDQEIEVLYKCHPANTNYNNSRLNILKSRNIKIVEYSIDCFLISDYFYSTVSSSLFEMQWLNGSVISPIVEDDMLYSKEYLDLIFYPKDDKLSSFDKALDEFIKSKIDSQFEGPGRIQERIAMLIGR